MSVGAGNRLPITIGLMLSTLMGGLDTTVVNVALPHMQGTLSATPEQITWVLTTYIVASAATMPVAAWLAARVGLKPMMLLTVTGFTGVSLLCGVAATLPQMVVFRILQGVMAAPMMPLCQAVLLNINPPERHARAIAMFTMASVVAPILGPVVGGYLTEDLSWRWCFYINLPAGIASFLLLAAFLPSSERVRRPFDFLGFGSLATAMASLQLMLDRGPTLDWFGSREVWVEAILAGGGLWVFLAHTLTAEHPLFDPAVTRDRNFVATTLVGTFVLLLTYASLTLLPLMMQGLLGYPVIWSGLLSAPRGVLMMVTLLVMGRLDAVIDRRLLVATGLSIMLLAFWLMSHFDLDVSGPQIVLATLCQGLGQGMLFVPLTTLGFATLAPSLRAEGSVVMNLCRNLGSSIGIALMQGLMAANRQTMHASLAAHLDPGDPVVRAGLPEAFSPATAQGAMALNEEITRQATMVAFVDDFRLMVMLAVVCLPLVLLLRQPRRSPKPATS
jgi:DHA2 family multidrug resistance protein